eukprot:CAMPEP_0183345676 /NCGR_PEP_ID=MMETSP0164_2-20130417/11025_1 /TAXON_ID=221442 /ORGANISM="Coccolithus pelagicus ssp braarudi, Strain PLY182g" /LENGTH=116 /DNA_ID=CAMNT_0025516847 /DNA_START=93 /DNA_END=441 /DNA_ORIENTATION=-
MRKPSFLSGSDGVPRSARPMTNQNPPDEAGGAAALFPRGAVSPADNLRELQLLLVSHLPRPPNVPHVHHESNLREQQREHDQARRGCVSLEPREEELDETQVAVDSRCAEGRAALP